MLALAAFTLVAVLTGTNVDGATSYSYMATFPQTIRSNSDYIITVLFAQPVTNEQVTARVIRRNRVGRLTEEEIIAEKTKDLPDGTVKTEIVLRGPAKISWGSYRLNITATGSIPFHNSSSINGRPNAHAIFVQTDKRAYKPGDTVQYRVFIVGPDLTPLAPVFDVEIFDPKGNKLYELTDQRNEEGIDGVFELSPLTSLGSWKIVVKIQVYDETETQYFDVQEYVLPKFEVTVNLPPFGHVTDKELIGTVTTKYTFGKPVKGDIDVTLRRQYGGGYFDLAGVRKHLQIDGTASFSFHQESIHRLTRYLEHQTLVVHAKVTETTTGISQEGEANIRFYGNTHTVEFYRNLPNNFKPGVNPYEVRVKVSQQDGRPPAGKDELQVTVSYFTERPLLMPPMNALSYYSQNVSLLSPFAGGDVILKPVVKHKLGKDGTVKFNLNIPHQASTASIKAVYKDASATKDLRRFRTLEGDIVRVQLLDGDIKKLAIGDAVTFRVTVTKYTGMTVHYQILSGGQVVESGQQYLENSKEGNIQVIISRDMAPAARFVVFYVNPGGEIISDALNFAVSEIFQNQVGITFDEGSPQEPNTTVSLRVTAAPGSTVNVLAVDSSVRLLAQGNDIDQDRVRDKMDDFGDTPWFPRIGWGDIIPPWPISADDPRDVFRNARLGVMTDGILYSFDLWSLPRQKFGGGPVGIETRSAAFAADNGVGFGGGGGAPTGRVRSDFPETWIWKRAKAVNGVATFVQNTPDTITTFVASAFALDKHTGLGVAATTANMTVFQSFFVMMQLPYSVIRGETMVVQANIFNYLDKTYDVTVVLKKTAGFVGISLENYGREEEITGDIEICVTVKPNEVKPVYFTIKPSIIGAIETRVRATIPRPLNIFDEVVRPLPVEAEGLEKDKNTPKLIVLKEVNTIHETVKITYPAELVMDSARIQVKITGDLLGPTLTNLGNLVRYPSGCGEQNMVNFAPAVSLAVYLNSIGRLRKNEELFSKITRVLDMGYQRELLYQRGDGSFSAFGNADESGSTWLTAFVAKSFSEAYSLGRLVLIDSDVVDKAVRFIARHQNIDGSIKNVGIVSHKALQGSSASSINALSSYILTALVKVDRSEILTNLQTIQTLRDMISQLTIWVKGNAASMTTEYEQAIGAYALTVANDPSNVADNLLQALEGSSLVVNIDNMRYWNHSSKALSLEIASYALSTYAARKDINSGTKVVLWLVKQRNSQGGFESTQDTVVALEALSAFAPLIHTENVNMEIDVCTTTNGKDSAKEKRFLTNENQDVLQIIDFLNGHVDSVSITAKGSGTALIDVSQKFNVVKDTSTAYSVDVTLSSVTTNSYIVNVCASFTVPGAATSNMAIIDIKAVSGFVPDPESVKKIPLLKLTEMSDNRLIIYLDEVPRTGICVEARMQRVAFVTNLKPAYVIVYSYYEPTAERVMATYLPNISSRVPCCNITGACKKKKKTG